MALLKFRPNRRKEEESRLNNKQLGSLIASIKSYYKLVDHPSADNIIVYGDSIKLVEDEEDTFEAVLKITKDWCGEKTHKMHIRFKAANYRFIPKTVEYI